MTLRAEVTRWSVRSLCDNCCEPYLTQHSVDSGLPVADGLT